MSGSSPRPTASRAATFRSSGRAGICSTSRKIYVLPRFQGLGAGEFLFRRAVEYIRSVHSGPCMMELNVNRRNRALHFYERMGMRRLREGDFPIGDGYYMNDYIMGLEIV